ncbi:hypothetical protein CRYPA_287 [uncultured Candidatus Thioglobus sp.]|nr:hypothetical protein CRYPA_287 [uncultured Candidatus Thioglobus sp.]
MSTKRFSEQLREIIVDTKANGTEAISCDNLIAYLDEVIASPSDELTTTQFENYKAELQVWIEQNKNAHNSNIEMFKSVISSGQNALRSAFLLNGGAAIAVLAFLGKLSEEHQDKITVFSSSLIIFVMGVLAVTMSSGFTYLSQWLYSSTEQKKKTIGFVFNLVAITLGLSSYGLFIWAMVRAYDAFQLFA